MNKDRKICFLCWIKTSDIVENIKIDIYNSARYSRNNINKELIKNICKWCLNKEFLIKLNDPGNVEKNGHSYDPNNV